MPSGGKREGAGRKRKSENILSSAETKKLALKLAAKGNASPLEVMVAAMNHYLGAGNMAAASTIAKDAAPYFHPRLASTVIKGDADSPLLVKVVDDID